MIAAATSKRGRERKPFADRLPPDGPQPPSSMASISSKLAASLFVPMRDVGAGAAGVGSKKLTRGTP